ncbi:MAG: TetR/AcrR family transcriptional regulator [Bacteroidetes bacterium]|nr:TetR/AcrR family transcriptional regulator [Bacteroidota bacterium]
MKERILVKATELFMRYGIRSITMDEIAAQLGISKKTIYQFYADKDEVVDAVIGEEIKQNEEECIHFRNDSEDAVHEVLMATVEMEEMLKGMNPLIMYDLEKHHPRTFKRFKDFKQQFLFTAIKGNLKRGIEEGAYREEIDIEIVTRYRIESIFMVFNPDIFPHNRYRIHDVLNEIAYLFLYGITTSKGRKLMEKYMQQHTKNNKHGMYE